jgi:hypothetical protein
MKNRILNYIKEFGSINTKQAFDDLGCTRLSEYIRQLREEMEIKDRWSVGINRWGEKTEWKEYFIEVK